MLLPIFLVKAISLHYSNVAIFNWIFIYLRVMIGFRSFDLTTDTMFGIIIGFPSILGRIDFTKFFGKNTFTSAKIGRKSFTVSLTKRQIAFL